MRYFIYPNGINAKVIAGALDLLAAERGEAAEYEFLDDSALETSLAHNAERIRAAIKGGGGSCCYLANAGSRAY